MIISQLVAMSKNRVIGRDNALPWYLPEDLKYFKRVTMGKPVVMGRKTYESIGKPLPGRTNIVITRNPGYSAEGVIVVHSLQEAMERATSQANSDGVDEVVIIGGGEIFEQAMQISNRLYITQVHAHVEGDAWYPEYEESEWRLASAEHRQAGGASEYDYSFLVLERQE